MANQNSDQLKKLGFALLGLGVLMAGVGLFMEKWQLYAGIGAAVLGAVITFVAMKK